MSELEPRLWRQARDERAEPSLAFESVKEAFWAPFDRLGRDLGVLRADLVPETISEPIFEKADARTALRREVREGHDEDDYDVMLLSKMEHKTPQFNLRNVLRATRDIEPGWIEWDTLELPDRHGFEADLAEVRTARHDPPELTTADWAGTVSNETRDGNDVVFWENDWEQWYGDDKRRAAGGALWRYVPEDGGKRTRPWPEDMIVVEHKYWKGRLITEDY